MCSETTAYKPKCGKIIRNNNKKYRGSATLTGSSPAPFQRMISFSVLRILMASLIGSSVCRQGKAANVVCSFLLSKTSTVASALILRP